ncbi:MAG: BspA family leucine-rich repeat surface protein, partial [Bacteroidota bacterium]
MKTIISTISIYLALSFCIASYAKTSVNVHNNIATTKVAATNDFDTTSFITVWETTTANESITIPTNSSVVYDYTVDWGDGTIDTNVTGDATHTFATPGTHTIKINGDFPRIFFNNSGDRLKIKEVTQWGTIQWGLMASAFRGCENLDVTATDTPDLSNTNNMTSMFFGCSSLVGNASFNAWDVSNVRFMFATFSRSSFNQPINNWNVSNVTNMQRMFSLTNFNQPLNNWNVSNVENMLGMFQDNTAFDQNLGSWDISSVTDMTDMFLNGTLSIENYDNMLLGWATLDTGETQIPTNINFNGGNSQYCNANLSRIDLINNYSWSISDGG